MNSLETEEIADEIFALMKKAQGLIESRTQSEIDAKLLHKTLREALVERKQIPSTKIVEAIRLLEKRHLIVVKPNGYVFTQQDRKVKHAWEA